MYKSIIVCLSLDHGISQRALSVADRLQAEGGRITAVHVFEPVHSAVKLHVKEADIEKARQASEERLIQRLHNSKHVEAVTLVGHAARSVTEYAEKTGADCIIIGSNQPRFAGILPGFHGNPDSQFSKMFRPCNTLRNRL